MRGEFPVGEELLSTFRHILTQYNCYGNSGSASLHELLTLTSQFTSASKCLLCISIHPNVSNLRYHMQVSSWHGPQKPSLPEWGLKSLIACSIVRGRWRNVCAQWRSLACSFFWGLRSATNANFIPYSFGLLGLKLRWSRVRVAFSPTLSYLIVPYRAFSSMGFKHSAIHHLTQISM